MTRVGFVVFFLRLVFGCVAVVAALMLALAGSSSMIPPLHITRLLGISRSPRLCILLFTLGPLTLRQNWYLQLPPAGRRCFEHCCPELAFSGTESPYYSFNVFAVGVSDAVHTDNRNDYLASIA
jgi:hypothetical protein